MIVSSLIVQRNSTTSHSISNYLSYFNGWNSVLCDLGIPVTLFLDKNIRIPDYSNLTIVPTSITELDTFNLMKGATDIKVADNPRKNTLDYHIINSAKIEFLERASLIYPNINRFSWVDFGISHFMQDPSLTCKKLAKLNELPNGIVAPGAHKLPSGSLDYPDWHFCGSFLSGDRQSIQTMSQLFRKAIFKLLPVATWEINVWSYMESQMGWCPIVYPGNHNDSIFNFEGLL